MKRFVIGEIPFIWKGKNLKLGEMGNMSYFLSDEQTEELPFVFEETEMDIEALKKAEIVKKTGGYELLKFDGKLFLMNHWATQRFGYGFFVDDSDSENVQKIYVNPDAEKDYPVSAERFFSTIGLHRKLLKKNAFVLHASFIEYKGKAILFTAPSQTGKSTQADLWNKYEDAQIINGDRVLVRKKGDSWYAYGYPCCGSSKICLNKKLPLCAIVVLQQGSNNTVHKATASESIKSLTSGTEVYTWNNREIMSIISMATEISEDIPVFKLTCRADKGAVSVLKSELKAMKIC